MTQGIADGPLEDTARERLRSLRKARGWSLDELAARSNISSSTLSRLETGKRRLAVDHLVTLARALDTSVDELVRPQTEDVVICPRCDQNGEATVWVYTTPDDASGRIVARMRLPEGTPLSDRDPHIHPGRDWFYVLQGTVRLQLGNREHLVRAGQVASFETMTPHTLTGHRGTAEILSIFDHHGERAHLRT